jgi:3-oxoacyl-[acyl-carrier-protein] synthase-3
MKFKHVCIESLGYTLPAETWTSALVEQKLEPLYRRLKLPEGRLELMTGIEQRGFWAPGTRPSEVSVNSGRLAIEAASNNAIEIDCLIHGSVCRDFLEPATACTVHHQLGLPEDCLIYDVSNACLGILSGMIQAACMIESGQIKSALIVGSEGGRQLVEATIASLNQDDTLTRKTIKNAIASLTIGSASAAVVLTHDSISQTKNRLTTATSLANTKFNDLCQSDQDQAGAQMQPLMQTDSEVLMREGVDTGKRNFQNFLQQSGLSVDSIDATVCHQVGTAHRKLMLESLGLQPENDFATFQFLGNTGAAALPSAFAIGCEQNFFKPGQKIAWLGIGSGINCTMMGIQWNESRVGAGQM